MQPAPVIGPSVRPGAEAEQGRLAPARGCRLRSVEMSLADLLARLDSSALLLALVLPPIIRVVGHLIPEELFMVAMGVAASRADSPSKAALLLIAVVASHFIADQGIYGVGVWLRPRLQRFARIRARLEVVTARLESSPHGLLALIPGRVFPIGRGAWLASCGVVGVPWSRFAAVDLLALLAHLVLWSGLGWWLADDIGRLEASAALVGTSGVWIITAAAATVFVVLLWRHRLRLSETAVTVAQVAGRAGANLTRRR